MERFFIMESVSNKLPKDILIKLISTIEKMTSEKYEEQLLDLQQYLDLCELLVEDDWMYIEYCCSGPGGHKQMGHLDRGSKYCKTICQVGNSRSSSVAWDNSGHYERCVECADAFCDEHVKEFLSLNDNGEYKCKNGCNSY